MRLLSTSSVVPSGFQTADTIDSILGQPLGWTYKKQGLRKRHIAETEKAPQLAAQASREALLNAGLKPKDLSWILCGSGTMSQAIPNNASALSLELGNEASEVPAMDVGMTCLGFLAALRVADAFFKSGEKRPILIACSDLASVGIHPKRPIEYSLFGDGAAAVVVAPGGGDFKSSFSTFPQGYPLCQIPGGGSSRLRSCSEANPEDHLFHMDGPGLYRLVREHFPLFYKKFQTQMHDTDFDLLIPHQASLHGMHGLRKALGFSAEKCVNVFADLGNQVSASIPTALDLALKSGQAQLGQRILFGGTSAGVSLGLASWELS